MVTILLHSSKTMRVPESSRKVELTPALYKEATFLASYLKKLSLTQIEEVMALSPAMAQKTYTLIQGWSEQAPTLPALDIFRGDIYSGLQVQSLSQNDRQYANEHLFILSGLYGVIRGMDSIQPYRLEMGYKLPGLKGAKGELSTLYDFWGDKIARQLPDDQPIINLSAKEYTKAVFPYIKNISGLKDVPIISPKFLTISPKTGEPTFVTVHAKIARGAFGRWLIVNRIDNLDRLKEFKELGYKYEAALSTFEEPVFIAKNFQGLGLSVRLV